MKSDLQEWFGKHFGLYELMLQIEVCVYHLQESSKELLRECEIADSLVEEEFEPIRQILQERNQADFDDDDEVIDLSGP